VVRQGNPEDAWLPAHRLLRGGEQVWRVLATEENFFKEIEVSGLLRESLPTLASLDPPDMQIVGEQ
jgi:hypothetical protein